MIELSDKIRRLPAYPAADGYGLEGFALLASNETPFEPMPGVAEAAAAAVAGLNRYPDPSNATLRAALAARYDLAPERIAVGNGSCDILLAAAEALLEPGAEVVHAWPSFSVYPQMAAATGARAVVVGLDGEQRHDLDAMLDQITVATRLVLLCNPNNPTGTAHPPAAIEQFLARVPRHVCVIVDEAYCEFSTLDDPDASLGLLRRHANLVLLRTFSKVYGLAGLRCGYALCGDERLRVAVDQVRQPFFCNAVAQAAAAAALLRQDELGRRVERTVADRLELEDGLRGLGLEVVPSQANFVWHSLGSRAGEPGGAGEDDVAGERERELLDGLRARKILIRSGSALGRPGWARTTVGTAAENARLLDALSELL